MACPQVTSRAATPVGSDHGCSSSGSSRLWLLPADEENASGLVVQDVEGNEFCLD